MNEGEWVDFAQFAPKIGCHGNVPSAIEKRKISNLRPNI